MDKKVAKVYFSDYFLLDCCRHFIQAAIVLLFLIFQSYGPALKSLIPCIAHELTSNIFCIPAEGYHHTVLMLPFDHVGATSSLRVDSWRLWNSRLPPI